MPKAMVTPPSNPVSKPPSNLKVDSYQNKPESPKMIGGKRVLDQKDIDMIINSKYQPP